MRLNAKVEEAKKLLRENLEKQKRLTEAYLERTIAQEVFKEQCALLRTDEETMRKILAQLEVALIERERSAQYRRILQRVLLDFEMGGELDICKKKEILRLVFKKIRIDGGRVGGFEMYEPFQTMYNERIGGIRPNQNGDKEKARGWQGSCILAPMDGRCSGNPGLFPDAERATVTNLTSVLQAVAEGLQAALAAA